MFLFRQLFYSSKQKTIAFFLKKNFNIYPKKIEIYEKALIHGSHDRYLDSTFERLEFLGDGVLDLIIRDHLYSIYPDLHEGELTKLKSGLVNRKMLSTWANTIKIEEILEADYGSMSRKEYVYGNAFEALIGAIFKDIGYQKTEKAVHFLLKNILKTDYQLEDKNYKGLLIEWAQKNRQIWSFDTQFNPKENLFYATVIIDHKGIGTGKGHSKKEAEQEASMNTCLSLQII